MQCSHARPSGRTIAVQPHESAAQPPTGGTARAGLRASAASSAAGLAAVVGNDGVIGISAFMGGDTTPSRAVVQSAGHAYRLEAGRLKSEFVRAGAMQQLLLRYTQSLLTQMAQTAVCNRHHSLEQQLCRWLLLSLDRLASNELVMTQELIADMLGVRRKGATDAVRKLQQAGLIQYSRGRIVALDRASIEARACECYAVVRGESMRLLPEAPDSRTHKKKARWRG
jgi:CRP-like cAMP-binding protein